MTENNHIIHKVFLEIDVQQGEKANYIKNNISAFLNEDFFPRLEDIFNRYDKEDRIIRYDHFDINFITREWDSVGKLKEGLLLEVERKIKNSETPVSIANKVNETDKSLSLNGFDISYNAKTDSGEKGEDEIPKQILPDENYRSTFVFFLENGFLPWYGKADYIKELTKPEIWLKNCKDPGFQFLLKETFQKSPQSLSRFVLQCSDELIVDFMGTYGSDVIKDEAGLLLYLKRLESDYRNLFLQLILDLTVSKSNKKEQIKGWRKLFWFRQSTKGINNEDAIQEFIKNTTNELSPFIGNELLINIISLLEEDVEVILKSDIAEIKDTQVNENPEASDNTILGNIPTIFSQESHSGEEKEPLFFETGTNNLMVQNAGLVLFHPFLNSFFKKFDWINKKGKIKKEFLFNAIQSLQYCATGSEDFFEGNMLLEKFLCGVPLKMPLPAKSLLNAEVKDEAEILLKNIVSNWPALKDTSPDGLRQMFVHRDGKLIQKDKGYKLIVERKVQDVLLDRLPWNISIIKLPWKDELLFVEW